MITAEQLRAMGVPDARIIKYIGALNDTLAKYGINTPLRIAHFLAQVLHESANFRYVEEIASGAAYEGRKDLGNVYKGDGVKFKGRGVIQLTGRNNYLSYSKYVGVDFIANPKLLATVPYCIDSAGYYWMVQYNRNLNQYADKDDLRTITRKVNGGYTHLKERGIKLALAKKALGI